MVWMRNELADLLVECLLGGKRIVNVACIYNSMLPIYYSLRYLVCAVKT